MSAIGRLTSAAGAQRADSNRPVTPLFYFGVRVRFLPLRA